MVDDTTPDTLLTDRDYRSVDLSARDNSRGCIITHVRSISRQDEWLTYYGHKKTHRVSTSRSSAGGEAKYENDMKSWIKAIKRRKVLSHILSETDNRKFSVPWTLRQSGHKRTIRTQEIINGIKPLSRLFIQPHLSVHWPLGLRCTIAHRHISGQKWTFYEATISRW